MSNTPTFIDCFENTGDKPGVTAKLNANFVVFISKSGGSVDKDDDRERYEVLLSTGMVLVVWMDEKLAKVFDELTQGS